VDVKTSKLVFLKDNYEFATPLFCVNGL